MECSVDIPALKKALAVTKTVVRSRSNGLPQLSGVHLEAGSEGLTLTTTDLDCFIRTCIPADVTTNGVGIVGHAQLAKGLKGKGSLTFRHDADDSLSVVNGSTSKLPTFSVDEWPRQDLFILPTEGGVDLDMTVIAKVLPAASVDESLPAICTVFFDADGMIAATDRYRLFTATLDHGLDNVLVPAKTLRAVAAVADNARFTICDTTIRIDAAGVTWVVRRPDSEYPPYKRLIPDSLPHAATFNRGDFDKVLDAVCSSVSVDTTPVVIHPGAPVQVTYSEHNGRSIEGWAEGTNDSPDPAGYNPAFLRSVFKDAATDTLQLADGMKPALVRWSEGPHDFTRLIMPVRIPAK